MKEDRERAEGNLSFASNDKFFRAINPLYLKPNSTISPGAFANSSGANSMSVDWAKYSSAKETAERWRFIWKRIGIAKITAQLCWDNAQEIFHTPENDNSSHCDVVGKKTDSIRKKFARGAQLVILVTPNQSILA